MDRRPAECKRTPGLASCTNGPSSAPECAALRCGSRDLNGASLPSTPQKGELSAIATR